MAIGVKSKNIALTVYSNDPAEFGEVVDHLSSGTHIASKAVVKLPGAAGEEPADAAGADG